jgi:hypothetical protein
LSLNINNDTDICESLVSEKYKKGRENGYENLGGGLQGISNGDVKTTWMTGNINSAIGHVMI